MVNVVACADSDAGGLFIAAVDRVCLSENVEPERVVFDCEGVNLSRLGSIEIVSVYFPSMEVFLVDVGGSEADPEIVKALKELFENVNVTKIVHDCRMDSDALFHLLGIKLENVHDTSCFHAEITGKEDENLNSVLMYNGVEVNGTRDKSVYKTNPHFWATRPLTQQMIDWASADVDRLFDVATKQLDRINNLGKIDAVAKSNQKISFVLERKVVSGLRVNNPGKFIGKRGANLRSLQMRTKTLVYQERPKLTWFVYYLESSHLDLVKRSMKS